MYINFNIEHSNVGIPLRRGVLDTTLDDKVCRWIAANRWFSPVTPVYSTNKTHRYGITEILLKVAQTIAQMFAILVATIELLYLFFLTSTHATLSLRKVIYGGFFFWLRINLYLTELSSMGISGYKHRTCFHPCEVQATKGFR
jgi:hypothetical protein